jgi:glycine/D-amino acid oxidase-like deaminating enzyme
MRSTVDPPSWLQSVSHPDQVQGDVSPETIRRLSQKLTSRLPDFAKAYWRRGYACVYDVTPDWHPILSLSSRVKGLFVAAGFSGHGFVMSAAIGRIIAEAVHGIDKNQEEKSLLRLERFEQNQPVAFDLG